MTMQAEPVGIKRHDATNIGLARSACSTCFSKTCPTACSRKASCPCLGLFSCPSMLPSLDAHVQNVQHAVMIMHTRLDQLLSLNPSVVVAGRAE